MKYDEAFNLTENFILENELITDEALNIAEYIGGSNFETLNSIIYYTTSYHDIKQCFDCEKEGFYFNDDILNNINNEYFNKG